MKAFPFPSQKNLIASIICTLAITAVFLVHVYTTLHALVYTNIDFIHYNYLRSPDNMKLCIWATGLWRSEFKKTVFV